MPDNVVHKLLSSYYLWFHSLLMTLVKSQIQVNEYLANEMTIISLLPGSNSSKFRQAKHSYENHIYASRYKYNENWCILNLQVWHIIDKHNGVWLSKIYICKGVYRSSKDTVVVSSVEYSFIEVKFSTRVAKK